MYSLVNMFGQKQHYRIFDDFGKTSLFYFTNGDLGQELRKTSDISRIKCSS